jgi:sulfite exporter TauE/SafE
MIETDCGVTALIFVSGVLGSAHCIGMCGGIAATMSLGTRSVPRGTAASGDAGVWDAHTTYVFLGVMAVGSGREVSEVAGQMLIWLQALFAIGRWRHC